MKDLDWSNLSFGYTKTNYNVRCTYSNGKWGELEVSDSEKIDLHIAATCLHYGQEAFEGLKAFRGKDDKIRVFRMNENAKRLQSSAKGVFMQEVPLDLFEKAVKKVVSLNKEFVPPYGSGASLYIRPLLIGTSGLLGVKPSDEYQFIVLVSPVGPYFKEGFKPTPVAVLRGYDRAAPLGTGTIKIGGNYAASLVPGHIAHEKGYSAVLFLDAKEKKYIDECGPANFFAIKGNKYITPSSTSILPSITNNSLMTIAKDLGLEVEQRKILLNELEAVDEAGQVGTAAVISPILRVDDLDENKSYNIAKNGEAGSWSVKLYETLRGIQQGDLDDKYNWNTIIE